MADSLSQPTQSIDIESANGYRIDPIASPSSSFSRKVREYERYLPIPKIGFKESQRVIGDLSGRCAYCGTELAQWDPELGEWRSFNLPSEGTGITWDHVHPSSSLGPACYGNITLACNTCNSEKSNLAPVEYLKIIYDDPFHKTRFHSFEKALRFFQSHYFDVLADRMMDYPEWADVVLNDRKINLRTLLECVLKYGVGLDGTVIEEEADWSGRADAPIIQAYIDEVNECKNKSKKYAFLSVDEVVEGLPEDWVIQQDGALQLTMEPDDVEGIFLKRMLESKTYSTKTNSSYQTKVTGSLNLFLAKAHEIINDGDNELYQLPSGFISDIYGLCVDGGRDEDEWVTIAKVFLAVSGSDELKGAPSPYGTLAGDAESYDRNRHKNSSEWSFVWLSKLWLFPLLDEGCDELLEDYWNDDRFIGRMAESIVDDLLVPDSHPCALVKGNDRKMVALKSALRFKNLVIVKRVRRDGGDLQSWNHKMQVQMNNVLYNRCKTTEELNHIKCDLQGIEKFSDLLGLRPVPQF